MTVRIEPPRAPQQFPETVLWTLTKADAQLEARVRFLPFGEYRPELRLYIATAGGAWTFLESMVVQPGQDFRELAQRERREAEVEGWRTPALPITRPLDVS